jgi:hypothetical protein
MLQVEAAPPVKVSAPVASVMVSPPVPGPVMVLAEDPEKVMLPPWVRSPVPVVIAPLLVVCMERVLPQTLAQSVFKIIKRQKIG